MRRVVSGIKTAIVLLLILVLGFNLYSLYQRKVNNSQFPMLMGYGYAVVASSSMEPVLSWGDLVIVHEETQYEVGDIVTFGQPEDRRTITHRIKKKNQQEIITKGDANNAADALIKEQQIFGRVVFTLPLIGYMIHGAGTPLGLLVIICVFILVSRLDAVRKEDEKTTGST